MNKTQKFIRENYRSLLGSFGLALVLWISVSSEKIYTTEITLPFEVKLASDSLMPVQKLPDQITLLVRGSGQMLFGLNFMRKGVMLDAADLDQSRVVDLRQSMNLLRMPASSGIKILQVIRPQKLWVDVDRRELRRIPVHIRQNVETEPGYLIVSQQVNPDTALVTGPAKLIRKLTQIETDSVVEANARYPVRKKVAFLSPRPGIITVSPDNGNVAIVVEPIVERTLYDVPVQLVNIPEGLIGVAEPKNVSVRVKGGETRISRLTVNEITVLFDYKLSYRPGTMNYPMQIITPPDVTWLEVSPKRFELQLIRKDTSF
ncbi:MAG: YbbR-like domain-containing protein [Calditrichaeota bacterium]|nr:MAG: YbbR-like domain-containing protein [Calditrichota bacterium]